MAILQKGSLLSFSGKVGDLVIYDLNGQKVVRSAPRTSPDRKLTPLEQLNRDMMKVTSQFLKPLHSVLNFGYKNIARKGARVAAFQQAQSHTRKHAIDFLADGRPYVNPEKILVFRGELNGPKEIEALRQQNEIQVLWEKCKGMILLLVAYAIDEGVVLFAEGVVSSVDGSFSWKLEDKLSRHPQLHLYAGYYDIIRGNMSDSVYVGCV